MLIKTKGIVFRRMKYRESSLIVDLYTEQLGIQSYIISGVRSKKSRISYGMFQVGSILDIVAYANDRQSLNRIKEVKSAYIYQHIPFRIEKSSVALFLSEVCKQSIKESEANEALYSFLESSFISLDDEQSRVHDFHIQFMIRLTQYLGIQPDNNWSDYNNCFDLLEGKFVSYEAASRRYCDPTLSISWHTMLSHQEIRDDNTHLNKLQRQQLLESLLDFYTLHIDNFGPVKSMDVLRTVMA